MIHYLNLTNGLACRDHVTDPHYCRIQSTSLEQKRFADVLDHAGDDLITHLALGHPVTIHDVSERPRRTRALWQGVPWIRYALERAWGLPVTAPVMRNGEDVTPYFDRLYRGLTKPQRRRIDYYQKFAPTGVHIEVCDGLGTNYRTALTDRTLINA